MSTTAVAAAAAALAAAAASTAAAKETASAGATAAATMPEILIGLWLKVYGNCYVFCVCIVYGLFHSVTVKQ